MELRRNTSAILFLLLACLSVAPAEARPPGPFETSVHGLMGGVLATGLCWTDADLVRAAWNVGRLAAHSEDFERCGYRKGDWHYIKNSMPHIVGDCIQRVAETAVRRAFHKARGVEPTAAQEAYFWERVKAGDAGTPARLEELIRGSFLDDRRLVGDFDLSSPGVEIAMWNPGWSSVPVYRFRDQDHGFSAVNAYQHEVTIHDPSLRKLVGDFDGDGSTEIALWRRGWRSTPVYDCIGSAPAGFSVRNHAHDGRSSWSWINE